MAEREFKVGDVVRYNDSIFNGIGVVREVETDGCFVDCFTMPPHKWHIAQGHFGDKFKEIIPDGTGWWFFEDKLAREECVVEYKGFRVGDRVVTVKKDSYHEIGCTGTVVGFDSTAPCPIGVRFDKCYEIRGGNLDGILPIDSRQGLCEFATDIKVIYPILGYIPEPEKPVEVKKYTDTAQVVIEKIRNLLTF